MEFDFLEHFKSLGNSIMSLFGSSLETNAQGYQMEGEQDDHDGEGIVEIEYIGKKGQN
jgi:hypothetical protein